MPDITPWAGVLNLIICPLLFVMTCWWRQWWLAISCLCVVCLALLSPMILPAAHSSSYGNRLWQTWFEDWTWLISFLPAWYLPWKTGMSILLLLGVVAAVQTWRKRQPMAWLVLMPTLGVLLVAIKFWNLLF